MTLEESREFFAKDRFATETCGITIDEVGDGFAKCSMLLTPAHLNAGGVAQGGAVFTLCDTAFAVAANAGGVRTVSASASITFSRPGTGDRLFAEAVRLSEGRSSCVYEVRVTDSEGRLVACALINGARKAPGRTV